MTSTGDVELRSVVKFCVALEKSPTETLNMIKSTGKYKKCSPATVYKWHARFRSGRDSIEDDPRSGRPAVVVCSVRDRVKDMVIVIGELLSGRLQMNSMFRYPRCMGY